jgi:hypothetical protein
VGCIECKSDTDCDDANLCTADACNQGICSHKATLCDVLGQICCPATGVCAECCSDYDCGGVAAASGSGPDAIPIPINCYYCDINGTCQVTTTCCTQYICPAAN